MKKKTMTDKTGEVRELTGGDIKKFRPAKQVLPAALLESLPKRKRGQRGVQRKQYKKVSRINQKNII